MAYNSDGYIMFDFSDVDFRRTTQTIPGLYDRCVKIIGTNKFILVINANGKTPLPSVCSFINNQYVIESCLYTFAITSNDTILIRRNEPDPSQLINDEITSPLFTWSSSKISDELNLKSNAIKSFTYTGNGELTKKIEFDTTPQVVWLYADHGDNSNYSVIPLFVYGSPYIIGINGNITRGVANSSRTLLVTYDDNALTFDGGSALRSFNSMGVKYTVYYIE